MSRRWWHFTWNDSLRECCESTICIRKTWRSSHSTGARSATINRSTNNYAEIWMLDKVWSQFLPSIPLRQVSVKVNFLSGHEFNGIKCWPVVFYKRTRPNALTRSPTDRQKESNNSSATLIKQKMPEQTEQTNKKHLLYAFRAWHGCHKLFISKRCRDESGIQFQCQDSIRNKRILKVSNWRGIHVVVYLEHGQTRLGHKWLFMDVLVTFKVVLNVST